MRKTKVGLSGSCSATILEVVLLPLADDCATRGLRLMHSSVMRRRASNLWLEMDALGVRPLAHSSLSDSRLGV